MELATATLSSLPILDAVPVAAAPRSKDEETRFDDHLNGPPTCPPIRPPAKDEPEEGHERPAAGGQAAAEPKAADSQPEPVEADDNPNGKTPDAAQANQAVAESIAALAALVVPVIPAEQLQAAEASEAPKAAAPGATAPATDVPAAAQTALSTAAAAAAAAAPAAETPVAKTAVANLKDAEKELAPKLEAAKQALLQAKPGKAADEPAPAKNEDGQGEKRSEGDLPAAQSGHGRESLSLDQLAPVAPASPPPDAAAPVVPTAAAGQPEPKAAEATPPAPPATSVQATGGSAQAARLPAVLSRESAASQPAVQVDSARLLHRVARAFTAAQQREGGEIHLRLSPPELGSLRLLVQVHEGGLAARLEAETPAARTALIDNLPALRERLAEQGVRLERFDVDLMQRQPGGTPDRPQDQPRQTPLQPRPASTNRPALPQPVRTAPRSIGSGNLNVIV